MSKVTMEEIRRVVETLVMRKLTTKMVMTT